MKKIFFLGSLAILAMSSCTKKTVNNYYTTPPDSTGTTNTNPPPTGYDSTFEYMGAWIGYSTNPSKDVWWYDSVLKGFYMPMRQADSSNPNRLGYSIDITVGGTKYTLPAVINGVTVDVWITDRGFDVNWYKADGTVPLYPVDPAFEGWVILKVAHKTASNKSSVPDHSVESGQFVKLRPHSSRR